MGLGLHVEKFMNINTFDQRSVVPASKLSGPSGIFRIPVSLENICQLLPDVEAASGLLRAGRWSRSKDDSDATGAQEVVGRPV